VVVEVPTLTSGAQNFSAWIVLEQDWDNGVEIEVDNGQLTFNYQMAGTWSTGASLPYNATQHRWWRIREQGGSMYWETSADGTSWNTNLQLAAPIAVTALDVEIGIECGTPCPTAPSAAFDNYNLPPP
jgi:regulation of enolase protein 1 (concanavalin A-like superfamily)